MVGEIQVSRDNNLSPTTCYWAGQFSKSRTKIDVRRIALTHKILSIIKLNVSKPMSKSNLKFNF